MKAIVACALNGVIGFNNGLPWHLPEDLKFFKAMTLGQTIVMGRKTFESLPKLLPGRKTVILSKQALQVPGAQVIHRFEELLDLKTEGDLWICGGAQLYGLALPYCRELYLTRVKQTPLGDTYFPIFQPPFVEAEVIQDTPEFCILRYIHPQPLEKPLSQNTRTH